MQNAKRNRINIYNLRVVRCREKQQKKENNQIGKKRSVAK